MKKLTLLLITLCMLITTTYAYNLTKIVNNNKLTTSVDEGTSVTITYTDVAGYTFTSWTATGVTLANSTSKEITFVMPANDVTITPNTTASTKYTFTRTINNVTETSQKTPGESITVTAVPKSGYEFTGWTATGITVANTATITFTMPSNDVTLVANFEESAHVHEYSEATCTEPPTCSCGATNGNALGHTWSNATCTTAKTCSVCGTTEGSALGHSWNNATCTTAKTCSVCGTTEGNALGHTWNNATCTTAKTCSVCGTTEGNALGHSWNNATCTEAKTCSVCSETEGNVLGHEYTGERTCNTNGTNDTVKCVRYGTGGCTASENQDCTHTYTITVTQGSNGTIALSSTSVKAGGSTTATIAPNSGYEIADVLVNGSSVGKVASYTFSNVTSNQTITASFRVEIVVNTDTSGANAPVIKTGLTPVNWNGTSWETTTEVNWKYNYNTVATATHSKVEGNGNGAWANAQTSDGSLYVWIPRYSYKITSGEHASGNSWNSLDSAGTNKIEVKFSNGATDDTSDSYIAHPAFDFGGTQLEGIWVAKYEASRNDATAESEGSGTTPASKPGVQAWRSTRISDMFSYAYNYNRSLESHMLKNSEWGVVAYLTNAIGRIPYINNSSSYITGNAGGSQKASSASGVTNAWNTANGVKASTTHNVYGIYDMSGGAYKYVAAYVDNGNSSLTSYGANLVNGALKYKDVYPMGTTDTQANNYAAWSSIKGDAVYETSNSGNSSSGSWDGDYSDAPTSGYPFFLRGGYYGATSSAGVFYFSRSYGSANGSFSFRVALSIQ